MEVESYSEFIVYHSTFYNAKYFSISIKIGFRKATGMFWLAGADKPTTD
jgi:hypothetical protein